MSCFCICITSGCALIRLYKLSRLEFRIVCGNNQRKCTILLDVMIMAHYVH